MILSYPITMPVATDVSVDKLIKIRVRSYIIGRD